MGVNYLACLLDYMHIINIFKIFVSYMTPQNIMYLHPYYTQRYLYSTHIDIGIDTYIDMYIKLGLPTPLNMG